MTCSSQAAGIYRALWWPKGHELELGERQLSK
jgi:hypothetical protein